MRHPCKGYGVALCGCSSRSPTQDMTSDMKFTDTPVPFKQDEVSLKHTIIEHHKRCLLGIISVEWLSGSLSRVPLGTNERRTDRHEKDIMPSTQHEWCSIFIIWYHFDKTFIFAENASKSLSTWRSTGSRVRPWWRAHTHIRTRTLTAEFNEFEPIFLPHRLSGHCPCIYLSIQASIRPFQAVNWAQIAIKPEENTGECLAWHAGR